MLIRLLLGIFFIDYEFLYHIDCGLRTILEPILKFRRSSHFESAGTLKMQFFYNYRVEG